MVEKEVMKNQNSQDGYFIIKEVDLSINLKNTIYFIDIEGVKQFSIQAIKLINSTLVQSQLLSSCTNNIIEDAVFQNIKLNKSSSLIINSDFLESNNVYYYYQSIIFSNIEYDQSSHFIRLQKQNTQNQTLSINQIKLLNNFCNHKIENQSNLTNSLLFLNLNYVDIQNLEILKMHGITELSIFDTVRFSLKSTYLQSQKKFENVGLHKYLECFINKMQNIQLSEIIIIYSSLDIIIENLTINNSFFHNSAFLLIKSADLELITQQERIQLYNLKLENNLIIQTDGQSQVSLIQIKSYQTVQIEINEIQFTNNILHQYYQNNLKTSATLINVDCELCTFSLIKSYVINNSVINGTDSIIFVNVREISLQNVVFDSNSVFLYELIQPFLFWEFDYDQEIYLDNIEEIFPIKSITGNGWFIAQKINIIDNKLNNSKGKEGGGFRLQGKGNFKISVTNLKLERISTLYQTKEEYEGALYFDGQNAQQLEININNVQANEVFCQNQGGLFFIQIDNINSKINIKNITFFNIFALKGSLAYINFFAQSSFEQLLNIKQVKGQNTETGLEKFFLSFKNLQNEDVYAFANNRSLLFVESGSKMIIENFMIYSSFCESLLFQNNGKNIGMQYMSVLNSSIFNQFVSINFIENEQTQFQLSDSTFQNLTFKRQISQHKCNQDSIKIPQIQFFCSSKYFDAPKQIIKFKKKQNQNNFFICVLNQMNLNPQSLMILNGLTSYSQIILQNIEINSILCENCLYGLIYFNIKSTTLQYNSIMIINIDLLNSNCGNSSCIYTKVNLINNDRILINSKQQIFQFQLKIQNYICQYNIGYIGTCLLIDQISTSIQNSIFQFNNSTLSGGALLVRGRQQFFMNNCIIIQNQAFIGGGIYLEDQQALSFSYFKVQLSENLASNFGNDFFNPPEKLSIIMNNSGKIMKVITLIKNQTDQIDEILNNEQHKNINFIYLPSGQQINRYEQFSVKKKTYQILNLSLYLVAVQSDNTIIKNLEQSSCFISSRKYDLNKYDQDQKFTNNYTNINNVFYDTFTNSYNLDELIILYYGIDNQTNEFLQLQFECDSIQVPNFNQTYPYNFINSHQNYKLRINVKTYPCQLGEIQNQTAQYCQKCDANLGFFSLSLTSNKCELKDEISTLEVKSAQLNLRLGYWRPYFDTSYVDYCINLPTNCLGGWIEGDNSCIDGHIGALCEQCDLYNIRGDGNFYEYEKFKCSNCTGSYLNIVVIIMISIWTFFTIYIAVNSNVKIQIEYTKLQPFNRLKLARNLNKTQSGALIKMFTGYFQIISSITTFRLSFPYTFVNTTNTIGMTISTMVQSQDCLLHKLFEIEIHYSKVIWLILLEIAYMMLFFFLFYLGTFCKWFKNYQTIMITMLLYIYIYFQPDIFGSLVLQLSYREISGYKWIQANLAFRYDTTQHFDWMIKFCLPLIFIFAFLIPFCLFLNLYNQKKNLENRQMRMKYGFLYHEYQNYAYFWEIVKIIEKQFIIFFQRFYEDQIVLKGIFILSISYFYQLLNSHYKPYYLKNLNQLDYYAANICLISFSFTIGAYVTQQNNQDRIQLIFLILVIFLNLIFTIYLLTKILEDYLKNIDNNLNQILIYIKSNLKFIFRFDFIRRFLINRLAKKKRINYLINRFRAKALQLAKGSIQAKKQISQTWKSNLESNCGIENFILNETKRRSLIFCSVDYSCQLRNSKQNMTK